MKDNQHHTKPKLERPTRVIRFGENFDESQEQDCKGDSVDGSKKRKVKKALRVCDKKIESAKVVITIFNRNRESFRSMFIKPQQPMITGENKSKTFFKSLTDVLDVNIEELAVVTDKLMDAGIVIDGGLERRMTQAKEANWTALEDITNYCKKSFGCDMW